mmetsp:Transcript_2363/g.6674  ORF Transcript_2363/g.6674 Transcript_2363/m.6674 type:complete len:295 (+) Transcript_2363:1890-2774(+)
MAARTLASKSEVSSSSSSEDEGATSGVGARAGGLFCRGDGRLKTPVNLLPASSIFEMTVGFLRSAFGDAVCGRGGGAARTGAGAGASAAWWSQAACSALRPSSGSSSSSFGGEGSGSGAAGSGSGSGGGGVGGAEPSSEVRSYPTRFARFFLTMGLLTTGLGGSGTGGVGARITSGSARRSNRLGSGAGSGSGSGSGSAGGGELRKENAEPVDSRPVAGGSGSAGVAGASGAGDGGFDASCFTERPPKRSISPCEPPGCCARVRPGPRDGGALLRRRCCGARHKPRRARAARFD